MLNEGVGLTPWSNELGKLRAREILHHQKEKISVGPKVQNANGVGVGEAGGGFSFVTESVETRGFPLGHLHDLQCHPAPGT